MVWTSDTAGISAPAFSLIEKETPGVLTPVAAGNDTATWIAASRTSNQTTRGTAAWTAAESMTAAMLAVVGMTDSAAMCVAAAGKETAASTAFLTSAQIETAMPSFGMLSQGKRRPPSLSKRRRNVRCSKLCATPPKCGSRLRKNAPAFAACIGVVNFGTTCVDGLAFHMRVSHPRTSAGDASRRTSLGTFAEVSGEYSSGGSFIDLGRIDGGEVDLRDAEITPNAVSDRAAQVPDLIEWRSRRWVVLVDDEFPIRRSVGDYVRNAAGYRVSACSDAQALLDLLEALLNGEDVGMAPPPLSLSSVEDEKYGATLESGSRTSADQPFLPDCIVCDVRMPGIDGITLLGKIRFDPRLRDLPVVLLTAKAMVSDRIVGYRAGADGYLPKPFRPEELISMVDNVIRRQEQIGINYFESTDLGGEGATVDGDAQVLASIDIEELAAEVAEIKELLWQKNDLLRPQEIKALTLLARGYTDTEIMIAMDIFQKSFRASMKNLWKKSSTSTKTELLNWATNNGYVNDGDDEEEINLLQPLPREITHLQLLAKGKTDAEIAEGLNAKESLIGGYTKKMFRRSSTATKEELLSWAAENGHISASTNKTETAV